MAKMLEKMQMRLGTRRALCGLPCSLLLALLLVACDTDVLVERMACDLNDDCPVDMMCAQQRCVFGSRDGGAGSDAQAGDSQAKDRAAKDQSNPDGGAAADQAAPDVLAPDAYEQDAITADTSWGPDSSSPDASRPDVLRPDNFAPDTNLPDNFRPDTNLPDNFRPDTNLPDNFRPDLTPPCEEIVVNGSAVAATGTYYYFDFDLDSAGKVRLLMGDNHEYKIYYTTNASGSWSARQYAVDGDDIGPTSLSVSVDDSNRIHLAHDGPDGQWRGDVMHYASFSGSAWQSSVLAEDTYARGYSLDTTASGSPRIAYYNYAGANEGIHVAVHSASWTHTRVQSGDLREPHLAVDSAGHSHVVYGKYASPKSIRYATNRSGSWRNEQVAQADSLLARVAVSASGAVVVAFKDSDGLKLIEKRTAASAWGTPVLVADNVGSRFDVVYDGTGLASVVYVDQSSDPRTVMLAAETGDGDLTYVDLYRTNVIGGAGPRIRAHGDRLHVIVPVLSPLQFRHIRMTRVSCP